VADFMDEFFANVLVCEGEEFDLQMSVLYRFNNWEDAQKFIKLSLDNNLIVQVNAPKETT
jgi:hypothetical protein